MTDQPAKDSPPLKRPLAIIMGVLGILILLCGGVLFFILRPRQPDITPALIQTAEDALLDPSQAPISLSDYHAYEWYPPSDSDYAVENGMVIFPLQPGNPFQDTFNQVGLDMTMTALAYAPDGRQLSRDKSPPTSVSTQSWYMMGEWYLYACDPVKDHPMWWVCKLLVGGNI